MPFRLLLQPFLVCQKLTQSISLFFFFFKVKPSISLTDLAHRSLFFKKKKKFVL